MYLSKDSFGCSYMELLQNHIQTKYYPYMSKICAHVKALQTGTAVALSLTELSYALRFLQLNVPEDKSILNLPERGQTDPNPVSTYFFSYTSVKKKFF